MKLISFTRIGAEYYDPLTDPALSNTFFGPHNYQEKEVPDIQLSLPSLEPPKMIGFQGKIGKTGIFASGLALLVGGYTVLRMSRR